MRLNANKTTYILIGSSCNIKKITKIKLPDIIIDGQIIARTNYARNLGITFDEVLSWLKHVNSRIGLAFSRLKHLYRFSNFLSIESKKTLCDSLVLSLFNYCDVVYDSISSTLKQRIQKVQNACIRFIFKIKKYERHSVSALINKINWLNMNNRRWLHSMMLCYKIVNNIAPQYLCNLFQSGSIIHSHNTRFSHNLSGPRCRTETRRRFVLISGMEKFNSLPINIKQKNNIYKFKFACKKYIASCQQS